MFAPVHKRAASLTKIRSRLSLIAEASFPGQHSVVSSVEPSRVVPEEILIFGYQEIKMPTSKSSGGESKRGLLRWMKITARNREQRRKAAHEKGTAHEFDSAEAREAGRKGGEASRGGKSGGGNSTSSNRGGSSAQPAKGASQRQKND